MKYGGTSQIYGGVCLLRPLPPPTTPLASLGLAPLAKPDGSPLPPPRPQSQPRGSGARVLPEANNLIYR
jgi:hypothetical protein